jgi:hypothetical protein
MIPQSGPYEVFIMVAVAGNVVRSALVKSTDFSNEVPITNTGLFRR